VPKWDGPNRAVTVHVAGQLLHERFYGKINSNVGF